MIVSGGFVVDGTGVPGRIADVAVEGGRITAVGDLRDRRDETVLDATGLVVAPGFVDLHSHSDLSILGHPAGTSKVLQGVTTEVVGNCGLSVVPVASAAVAAALRPTMTYCDDPTVEWDWTGVSGYRARIAAADPSVGIEVLAGHGALRASAVGFDERAATPAELSAMTALLEDALDEGALGLSLGLMYPPSSYADEAELVALARTIAEHDALLAVHLADYSGGLVDAVAAMIRIAEIAGCRLQISHLTAVGREHWGAVPLALALIDSAIERGVDVAPDFYPYLAGSTNLSQLVPGWAMSGGPAALRRRIADPAERERIIDHLADRPWSDYLLVATPGSPDLDGRRLPEAALERGLDEPGLVLELLAAGDPTIVAFGRSQADLDAVMVHSASVLGSDGLAVDPLGIVGGPAPHPRFFGAFPAVFEHAVRERGLLTLEDAVRKCTAAPAERVRLRDRGRIEPGLRGDLVVFDPATIADRATYTASRRTPEGIVAVIRAGTVVASGGRMRS